MRLRNGKNITMKISEKQKCTFDPTTVHGAVGMFHCPDCGDMQIAGLPHIAMDDLDTSELKPVAGDDDSDLLMPEFE